MFRITFFIFLLLPTVLLSQSKLEQWTCHLSFKNGVTIAEAGNKVFCGTDNGMFYVNPSDKSMKTLCVTDGFSDIYANKLSYDSAHNILFIAYKNGNIDLLKGSTIINRPEYLNANISGIKQINNFYIYEDNCYISTQQGFLIYRISKNEFGDYFFNIGPNGQQLAVNDITVLDGNIYAATSKGIMKASISEPFLQNYSVWSFISTEPTSFIEKFENTLWESTDSGTINYWNGTDWTFFYQAPEKKVLNLSTAHGKLFVADPTNCLIINKDKSFTSIKSLGLNDGFLGSSGKVWMAKNFYAMVSQDLTSGKIDFYKPNGPYSPVNNKITSFNGDIFIPSGGLDGLGAYQYNNNGFSKYHEGIWTSYNATNDNFPDFRDFCDLKGDPLSGHYWMSSVDTGLIEMDNDFKVLNLFTPANTGGVLPEGIYQKGTPVYGLAYDLDNNLWMTCYRSARPLAVRKANGKWYSFGIGPNTSVTNLIMDDYNHAWIIAQGSQPGLYVYNYGNNIEDNRDDQYRLLSDAQKNGALPTNTVLSIAKDKDGQVWVGTTDGVALFSNPDAVFDTRYNFDALRPWVKTDNTGGYLLMYESVTAIAVDGANRKWFGTRNGVWLTSDDGTRILKHFNTTNSPLISDYIQNIGINDKTGEVFFGTDKGIVSYQSDATEAGNKFENVLVYPNPVKPGYKGPIAIKGLAENATVKITDITGNLVFETVANGGFATWTGKNFSGVEAQSGVYLVYCNNQDGSETFVTKILIIR
jgi:hypothetical protein